VLRVGKGSRYIPGEKEKGFNQSRALDGEWRNDNDCRHYRGKRTGSCLFRRGKKEGRLYRPAGREIFNKGWKKNATQETALRAFSQGSPSARKKERTARKNEPHGEGDELCVNKSPFADEKRRSSGTKKEGPIQLWEKFLVNTSTVPLQPVGPH